MLWIRWTASTGFGGRLALDSVVAMDRITHIHDHIIRDIWKVIIEINKSGDPIDALIVASNLANKGIIDQSSSFLYLTEILSTTINSLNGPSYAQEIKDLADRRRILELANTLANVSIKPILDSSSIVDIASVIVEKAFDKAKPVHEKRLQITAKELCLQPISETTWLLENLLVAGGINLIVGEPSSGKTFLTLDLALGVATNGMAWGTKETLIGNVIYFCQDSSPNVIHRRIAALCKGRGIDLPSNLIFDFSPLNLTKPETFSFLRREIKKNSAQLLVFDVLARYTPGADENAVSAVGPILTGFRELANQTNCTILPVHHVNKGSNGYPGSLGNRIRGSSDIFGSADAALIVTASGPKTSVERKVIPEKNREGIEEHPMIFSIISDEDQGIVLDFHEDTSSRSSRIPVSKQAVASEIINEHLLENPDTRFLRSNLEQILQEKGGSISKRTIDRVFADLRDSESIVVTKQGKQYEYSLNQMSVDNEK
jgi:hypothetical protein